MANEPWFRQPPRDSVLQDIGEAATEIAVEKGLDATLHPGRHTELLHEKGADLLDHAKDALHHLDWYDLLPFHH